MKSYVMSGVGGKCVSADVSNVRGGLVVGELNAGCTGESEKVRFVQVRM